MPASAADPQIRAAFRRPFAEQVALFRAKLGNLVPTERWTDLWKEQHDRAFMVAGAAKADLLADLAAAVDRAIAEGESIDAFRRRFDELVERHGWAYRGERNWRTRVIYTTNAATSYAAGRLAQLKEAGFALWVYRHSDSVLHPRPLHLAWDGLTLPADHQFWQTHYPPNGWGCKCYVLGARDARGARRLGGDPDKPLDPAWLETDSRTGEPVGIERGWGYEPGGTVAEDVARAVARKTIAWPYEIAKAYMVSTPSTVRDALAVATRSQPETGEAVRRYAERALGIRGGEPIDRAILQPYQTLGLLTTAESEEIARLTGVSAVADELWDWAIGQYAPRHIQKEHGDPTYEQDRGRRVPVPSDYARIPAVILDPDRMWSDDGQTVLLEKVFGEERMIVVFQTQKKRRMMALASLRIYRRSPRAQRP